MILNGLMVLILRYFTEFSSFEADYVKVIEKIDLYCKIFTKIPSVVFT